MDKIEQFFRSHGIYVAYGAALTVLAIAGWLAGSQSATAPDSQAPRDRVFELPNWSAITLGEQRDKALSIAAFEPDPDELAALAKANEPPTDEPEEEARGPGTSWRFIGTIRQGEQSYAVLIVTKPFELLMRAVSDPLPNEERLISIEPDRIAYQDEAGEHELRLFEQATPAIKE